MGYQYDNYRNSDYWQELTCKIRRRDNLCCRWCGDGRSGLEIHHIKYGRWYDENENDLITLCRRHHQLVEDMKKVIGAPRTEDVTRYIIGRQYDAGVSLRKIEVFGSASFAADLDKKTS